MLYEDFLESLPDHRKAEITLWWLDYNRYERPIKPKRWWLLDEFNDNFVHIIRDTQKTSSIWTPEEWEQVKDCEDYT